MFYSNQMNGFGGDRMRSFQKNITTGEKLNQMMEDQNIKSLLLNAARSKVNKTYRRNDYRNKNYDNNHISFFIKY